LFDEDFGDKFEFDVLDATKITPEERVPVRRVGRLVLDRTVDISLPRRNRSRSAPRISCPASISPMIRCFRATIFSYLDTRLKRLGGPNFTHLPINAPKCPFHTLQQDGHMAILNPKGRVNYEPNSGGGAEAGPREAPERGFRSYPEAVAGDKLRVRGELFADHYSQARQFYVSQTPVALATSGWPLRGRAVFRR
jgi:catalase